MGLNARTPISRAKRTAWRLKPSTQMRVVHPLRMKRVSSYSGIADRPDRAKAIAAVIVVHVALALVILSGLNVKRVGQAVDQLTTTIEIREEPPPPPQFSPGLPIDPPANSKEEGTGIGGSIKCHRRSAPG